MLEIPLNLLLPFYLSSVCWGSHTHLRKSWSFALGDSERSKVFTYVGPKKLCCGEAMYARWRAVEHFFFSIASTVSSIIIFHPIIRAYTRCPILSFLPRSKGTPNSQVHSFTCGISHRWWFVSRIGLPPGLVSGFSIPVLQTLDFGAGHRIPV